MNIISRVLYGFELLFRNIRFGYEVIEIVVYCILRFICRKYYLVLINVKWININK